MRNNIWLITILMLSGVAFAQGTRQITMDDLWKNNTFRAKDVPGFRAMKDGTHYTQIDREDTNMYIRVYDLATGKREQTLFDRSKVNFGNVKGLSLESYALSKDEKKMLLFANSESIYRHSSVQWVYVYDISTGRASRVSDDKIMHALMSPDGRKVAYVHNNNLFVKDLDRNTTEKITADGERNKIINGNCDWVYEEEFAFTRAFDWSPDSRYLAYYRFDESKVPEYTMAKYNGLYPEQYTYKYPKAGERNSVVQIKIYDAQAKQTRTPFIGSETDQYIPRIKWTPAPGKLCIYRLNRLQTQLDLLLADAGDGRTTEVYNEVNRYYININDQVSFLPDGHSMIFSSERNGYSHLYHYDWESKKITDLIEGNYDVDALVSVDVPRKLVYYSSAEASPLQRKLYVVNWMGKNRRCLTPEEGTHSITPCEGNNFFLDRHSRINKVPVYSLRNANGDIVRILEDNSALDSKLKEFAMGRIRLTQIMGANELLNAWIITPPGFDSTKRYPVLMYQYSGPASQEVGDRFPLGNYYWHQMLAQKGYIIVCADGTGTGMRGEEFRKRTYLQLGKYESDDQVAVARNLGRLPYVDKNRIGIWGWSYGGFMSSTCLFKGNDVFKSAIAVAPVTNWRYYDNIYTERYMRTPQENPKGYDENAPEKMADSLKGRFLLIHGTGDDNVHFQNSVMLTTALINANKQFESEYYPDKAHGISGGNTRYQLYNRMTDFILKNL